MYCDSGKTAWKENETIGRKKCKWMRIDSMSNERLSTTRYNGITTFLSSDLQFSFPLCCQICYWYFCWRTECVCPRPSMCIHLNSVQCRVCTRIYRYSLKQIPMIIIVHIVESRINHCATRLKISCCGCFSADAAAAAVVVTTVSMVHHQHMSKRLNCLNIENINWEWNWTSHKIQRMWTCTEIGVLLPTHKYVCCVYIY